MIAFKPADEGLGASYARDMKRGTALAGVLLGIVIAVLLMGPWAVAGAVIVAVVAVLIGFLAQKKIGGINGDVLGAIQQVSEIALLVMSAAVVRNGHALPWWR
jgi:adenosylcobinamide-GDP ribazoletransferase